MARLELDHPVLGRAKLWPKGRYFEEFEVGRTFEHHWGRTLTEAECTLFASLTLSFNPLYFNREFAVAHGHRDLVASPLLVFLTAFGLSVEDLSEAGGAFLGVESLEFLQAVYPGETLTARSTVVRTRESESRPGFGIVTWRTEGFNQEGVKVVEYERTNLVRKRDGGGGTR